ncbi:MAG: phage related lysozyme [Belnapia sp.]|nr:phage related lysozyme [Belnapia sp.]
MADMRAVLMPMLLAEEGVRLMVYDDATGQPIKPGTLVKGHPTVGIGRALDTNGITEEEAEYLLGNDVEKVCLALDKDLPWWSGLTVNRRAVLAAMAFQMGVANLMGFKNTLASLKAGDYAGTARGMLASLWARQTPARAKRMADMMVRG